MLRKLLVIAIISLLLLSGTTLVRNAKGNNKKDVMWGQFQHDARHTGRSNADMSNNTGQIKWKIKIPCGAGSLVMSKNGEIYTIDYNCTYLYIIDSKQGQIKKKINLDELTSGRHGIYLPLFLASWNPIAVSDSGYLYISKGSLYSLYPNGTLRWSYKNKNIPTDWGTLYNNTLYVKKGSYGIYAIDTDGNYLWNYTLPLPALRKNYTIIATLPVVSNDGTIYFSTAGISWNYPICIKP